MRRFLLLATTFSIAYACSGQDVNLVQITEGKDTYKYPAWSPQEGYMAVESSREGNWDIYLIKLEDRSMARLTDDPADDRYPTWDPTGVRLLFQSNRSGKPELYVLNMQTKETSLLGKVDGEEMFPDWSPDGQKIAFSMAVDSASQIIVLDAAGTSQMVAESPFDSVWPRWSPDNTLLAFYSRRDTNGKDDELYVANPAAGTIRRLTNRPGPDVYPTWSPSGDEIASIAIELDGTRMLQIIPLKGERQRSLKTPMFRMTEPDWSPDGKFIAVSARKTKADPYQIFVVKVDQ
ncbi:MAG: hypothetical protein WBW88_09680 [Rhodothermales bacterium]